jgi:hypothetical protein
VTVNGTIVLQEIPVDFTVTTYLLITDPTRFGDLFCNALNSDSKSLQSTTKWPMNYELEQKVLKKINFGRTKMLSSSKFENSISQTWGALMVTQWLRYCATNRNVAGSIPDGVIGIFRWHNPSDRTTALGSTQPLTEMSTRSIYWG